MDVEYDADQGAVADEGYGVNYFRAMRFFDHITGEPLSVFHDQECLTPHAQPIFCDANGRWPPIFLDGAEHAEKVYGVSLLNSNGVEIWRLSPLVGTMKLKSFWWRVLFGP